MVFFTCNGCGSSLKKNQVEKHQQFQCRKSQHLSCVDCQKDFYGEEYKAHTKCITEAEKYSGKGYVAKPGQNKNERKQAEWVAMVQDLVHKVGNTDAALTQALHKISQHENIPRKKPKFMNFLKNILGNRVSPSLCEQAWNLISSALEEQKASKEKNGNIEASGQPKTNAGEQTTTATTTSGTKRKTEVEKAEPNGQNHQKKKKKGEASLPQDRASGDDAGSNEVEEEEDETNGHSDNQAQTGGKVKWGTIGKTILRAQDDKELPLKKFQKKIIAEYLSRTGNQPNGGGDSSVEALWAKCLKKLSKNPKFKIHKERIKLAC